MPNIRSYQKVLFTTILIFTLLAISSQGQEIQVDVVNAPHPFLLANSTTNEVDKKIESSAVEPIGDGALLLVADDENKDLIIVDAATGRIKGAIKLRDFAKKPKWEGLARDDDGAYYVIGSFSVKKPTENDANEKLRSSSVILRFRLKNETGGALPVLEENSVVEWDLTKALEVEGYSRDPILNKVKVEGIAVRTLRDSNNKITVRDLVIGLRKPDAPLRVYATDLSSSPAPNTSLPLRPLFRLSAGKRDGVSSQLSSLEYIPAWAGFLILTSTEDDQNRFHGNTLWFLADEKIASALDQAQPDKNRLENIPLVEPQRVWIFGLDGKAEGLAVFSEIATAGNSKTRQARVGLVYDNDGITPSSIQFLTLVAWPK